MKCPGCGYESFDLLETCKRCGTPMVATALASGSPAVAAAADQTGAMEDKLDMAPPAGFELFQDDEGSPFHIDDDLVFGHDSRAPGAPAAPASNDWPGQGGFWLADGTDLPGPAFALSGEEADAEAGVEPIIDRYDQVPEHYWAPEDAGLGRRALALLVDQTLLLAVLGLFFLGAYLALRLTGFDTGVFLAAAGLRASALPFALLAAVLSFAYSIFFHGFTGCTPGKSLVGIEVRTVAGGALSWGRANLRWLGAALGLACAGIGILWALFEPRRRGWADLFSGTVVARLRQEPGAPL